jgi:hypothetical protein
VRSWRRAARREQLDDEHGGDWLRSADRQAARWHVFELGCYRESVQAPGPNSIWQTASVIVSLSESFGG